MRLCPFEPTKENIKKVANRLNKNGETALQLLDRRIKTVDFT
jgi:hypothetical protein